MNYALPAVASAEVKRFLSNYAVRDFPSAFIAGIPGGHVFGSGNVLSPDGKSDCP